MYMGGKSTFREERGKEMSASAVQCNAVAFLKQWRKEGGIRCYGELSKALVKRMTERMSLPLA